MLKAKTTTARFQAPANEVYNFVSDINNLPKWATAFCQKVRQEGSDHIVTTPGGDIFFRIDSDAKTGIVDFWGGPQKDMMMRWPVRVVDDNIGGSILAFTNIQMPDQPDEIFESQCDTLVEEFDLIKKHVDG